MTNSNNLPRSEPVRPQFFRPDWVCLNGVWEFHIDPLTAIGDFESATSLDRKITVPFAPESALSGIGETGFMESIWYRRTLSPPPTWEGKRVLLHFGAVDWLTTVFVDGEEVGRHQGGTTHFSFEITAALSPGKDHNLVVHAVDRLRSGLQPAGKQSSEPQSWGCYYTRTTGIWQPVWLEATGRAFLRDVRIVPDLAGGRFVFTPEFDRSRPSDTLRVTARLGDETVGTVAAAAQTGVPVALDLDRVNPWSPGSPTLYDLIFELLDEAGCVMDEVRSYAGLRSVAIDGDRFLLNGDPIYLRFVLDQGFYPEGIWTAPSDTALKRDIELSIAMGFNGARLHQKVFEPRFHYWADRLGYMTWGESASWGCDVDKAEAVGNFLDEWLEIVREARNHPSIIAWTPLNETGHRKGRAEEPISDQHRRLVERAAAFTRLIDPTRPVNDASGWVHRDTDIWTSHSYEQNPEVLRDILAPFPDVFRNAPANEPAYSGQPFMLDEFGGAACDTKMLTHHGADPILGRTGETSRDPETLSQAWGYGEPPKSLEEFQRRVTDQVDTILAIPHIRGYCYTQLTDVEQEQNGLLTYQREPKLPLKVYYRIFSRNPQTGHEAAEDE